MALRSSLKSTLAVLALGVCAVFVQGVVLKAFAPTLVVPNLIVILIVYLSFHRSSISGVLLSFLLGLELDLFSNPALLGPYCASSVAVFALVSTLSHRLFLDSFVTVFLAVLLSTLLYEALYFVVVSEFVLLNISLAEFARSAFIEALISAFLAPILFRMLSVIKFGSTMRAAMV